MSKLQATIMKELNKQPFDKFRGSELIEKLMGENYGQAEVNQFNAEVSGLFQKGFVTGIDARSTDPLDVYASISISSLGRDELLEQGRWIRKTLECVGRNVWIVILGVIAGLTVALLTVYFGIK